MALTSHKTEELKAFINDNEDRLSAPTMKTYINDYKRFRTLYNSKKNLANLSQSEIISIVKTNEDYAKINLIKIALAFLRWKDKPVNMVEKYLDGLIKERTEGAVDKNIEIIKNSGATYEQLFDALDRATGTDFILFYLLIKFNTRNNDLIMRVINSKENEITKNENFMVVHKNKSTYIRNEYKTKATYGTKKDVIRNLKFQKIMRDELNNNNEYLFVNNKKKPYKQTEMGNYIKARFKFYIPDSKLTQAVIYKIIQNHAEKNKDIDKLKSIADSRGHTVDTAFKYYSSTKYDDKQAEEMGSDSD